MMDDLIMTKKQAIAILQNLKPAPYRGDGKSITHVLVTIALNMAIEALEQEHDPDKITAEIKEKFDGCSICEWFDDYSCDVPCPIESLDAVLDKIEAEIEQEIASKPMEMWDYRMGLTKALDIIDKHRKESDGK